MGKLDHCLTFHTFLCAYYPSKLGYHTRDMSQTMPLCTGAWAGIKICANRGYSGDEERVMFDFPALQDLHDKRIHLFAGRMLR